MRTLTLFFSVTIQWLSDFVAGTIFGSIVGVVVGKDGIYETAHA